jgi:ParB-like chromosome segregation protein Spo0J
LVREDEINEGQFIIIDGEHRWTVAKELGYKKIPITILSKNQVDSMVSTIAMNKIKGEFDPIKLAEVIKKLLSFYTIEELEDKLGYTKDEFNYLDSLLKVNINTFENKDDNIYKEKSEIKELTFDVMLDKNTFDLLKNTLSQIDKNESKAFIILCKKYNG